MNITLMQAQECLIPHNSYSRLDAVLCFQPQPKSKWVRFGHPDAPRLSRPDFFRLLGQEWCCCDNTSAYAELLDQTFMVQDPSRKELDLMMTSEEYVDWQALPDPIVAYRGCSSLNREGFSYTLDRQMAIRFPTFFNRYKLRADQEPLLLTVEIPKARTVLLLGRGEQEIVATRRAEVRVVSEVVISPEEARAAEPARTKLPINIDQIIESKMEPTALPKG